jgi:hypothetical protein
VKLVERFGTKRVVAGGMLVFATGLIVASTITVSIGYPRLGVAMVLLGAGLGLASAPATESIMGSLRLSRAGVVADAHRRARRADAASTLVSPRLRICVRPCPPVRVCVATPGYARSPVTTLLRTQRDDRT